VKEAIRTIAPQFCARRMVKEYAQRMYAPALGKKVRSEKLEVSRS
jgi:glucan phosphorylase